MLAICIFLGLLVTIQARIEGFIVGGQFAYIHKYPHSAFLMVSCVTDDLESRKLTWACGSSIINQRILLTAGHCVFPCGAGTRITVNMGNEDRGQGVSRTSSGFLLHENYDPNTSDSDIALVKLSKPAIFNERVSRVAIMKNPPYDETAVLAGWGLSNEKSKKQSIKLKSLRQKVWRYNACQQLLFGELPHGTICASSGTVQEYAAPGDSGSGLVVRGYIQIGLVSYKSPIVANNVIIYTDVGFFYEWINYNAHRLYCFTSIVH